MLKLSHAPPRSLRASQGILEFPFGLALDFQREIIDSAYENPLCHIDIYNRTLGKNKYNYGLAFRAPDKQKQTLMAEAAFNHTAWHAPRSKRAHTTGLDTSSNLVNKVDCNLALTCEKVLQGLQRLSEQENLISTHTLTAYSLAEYCQTITTAIASLQAARDT
jgi:hypothetical protein